MSQLLSCSYSVKIHVYSAVSLIHQSVIYGVEENGCNIKETKQVQL